MSERDKFLTEAMGECVFDHRKNIKYTPCYECGVSFGLHANNDFSTWEGFGKLWEWAQEQEWWNTFALKYTAFSLRTTRGERTTDNIYLKMIDPNSFANAVYEFLKDRNEQ